MSKGDGLDPKDWTAFRAEAHRMLEASLDQLEKIRDRPWQPVPKICPRAIGSGRAVIWWDGSSGMCCRIMAATCIPGSGAGCRALGWPPI